jgi:hypothetical protein
MTQSLQTFAALAVVALAALWWIRHTFGRRRGGSCGGCEAGSSAHRLSSAKPRRRA